MDKPKPCPFCGSDAKVLSLHTIHEINCTGCHACLWREGYNEAIAAWNRRAPVEWTVTRDVLRAALRAGDKAVVTAKSTGVGAPGVAMMRGGIAVVEALGGKVEG